jgi:hypothetical protein
MMRARAEEQKIKEEQNGQMVAQTKLERQRYIGVARRERLERAKKLEASGRFEEAARVYYELEMSEKARECRRMSRGRLWERRVQ